MFITGLSFIKASPQFPAFCHILWRSFHPYLRLSQSVGCLIALSFGPSWFDSLAFFWRLTAHVKISWCPLYHCHCPSECKWDSRLFDLALSVCLPVHRLIHLSNYIRHYIFLFIYMFMSTHVSIHFTFCNSLLILWLESNFFLSIHML